MVSGDEYNIAVCLCMCFLCFDLINVLMLCV